MTTYRYVCRDCAQELELFGGVFFEVGAGAACRFSPDTQHHPLIQQGEA